MMSQQKSEHKSEYMWESKWEYKSFHCFLSFTEYRVNNGKGSSSIEVSEFLNQLGQEGWELSSTMQKTTDYEQIMGGSGHPVGIKAHKTTGYELIMKRKLVKVLPIATSNQDILSLLEGTTTRKNEIENAILDTDDGLAAQSDSVLEELAHDLSIEDLTEASKTLAGESKSSTETTPLLENTFYSGDSSAST